MWLKRRGPTRKAIELDRDSVDPRPQLGSSLMQGSRDEAVAAYQRAPAFDPTLRVAPQPHHYYIRTTHKTYLFVDKATGRVQHGSEVDEGGLPLLYFELEPITRYGFLTPAGPFDRFVCGGVVATGGILLVRRVQLSATAVAFQQIVNNSFLSAWVDERSSSNVMYRDEALEWEKFSLHRIRWELPQHRLALAAALISLLAEPPCVASNAAAIVSAHGDHQDALLALCFDRLNIDEFVALLDTIRAQMLSPPPSDTMLQRLLELRAACNSEKFAVPECLLQSGDADLEFWVGRILPDLMTWRRDRNHFLGPNRHVRLDTDLDFLAHLERGVSVESPGRLYNFLARYSSEPTRGICAVATARNEGVYLLEWLAYHKAIGIETFFIYSNDNDDGSDRLLERLSEAGAIYWLESIVRGDTAPQNKAYSHALNALPHVLDYQWAIFIDIDEFLVIDPDQFSGLSDYVAWQEQKQIDAVALNWVQMSSSGLNKWSPQFLRNRFTQRWAHPDKHIKSMFRPQRFLSCHPHYPITDWRVPVIMRDSSRYPHLNYYGGDEPAFLCHPKAQAAWINHYSFKSAEEYVWRRWRGSGNHKVGPELLTPFWLREFAAHHWSTDVVHDDRILRCGKSFHERYEELLNISGVPEILGQIHENFRNILRRVIGELLIGPVFDNADDLLKKFFACLMEPGGLSVPNDFDADTYLGIHRDVAEAGVDPTLHYLRHGRNEGRRLR